MKKLLTVLIGFALVAGSASSVRAADIPDEQWVKSGPSQEGGSWGIAMTDDIGNESPIGYLTSIKADGYVWGSSKQISIKTCSSFPSAACPQDEFQTYQTPLGFCKSASDTDCVADIYAEKSDGTKLGYKFVRNFPDENPYSFSANLLAKLPASGNTFLIDIPDAPHAGGSLYIVSSVLAGSRMPNESSFRTDRLNVSINAVSLQNGSYNLPSPITAIANNGAFPSVGRAGDPRCAIQCSKTEIALGQAMDLNLKLGVKIRLNAKVTGWLNGRVSKVESTILIDNTGMQEITVKGNPVKVPVIFGWVQKASAPSSLKNFYGSMTAVQVNGGNGYGKCLDPALPANATPGPCNPEYWESVLRGPQKNLRDLQEVALWLPVLKDTAVAAPTRWNINSTDSGVIGNCSADSSKLTGIVTTNATGFVSGPPEFNKVDQVLEYKVLAPHYLKDGSTFLGTYDLAIDSTYARCIYGFTSAPVSASVSVISTDGTNQVATVITNERDGWIHLGAYGFTFSAPTVKVKLSQEVAKPVVLVTPTPTAIAAAPIKKSITCIKGKSTKKVTAVNPKCPTGYKKKAA
ncbi:hypothetical protein MCEMRE196_01195 [Candidatus Nanopelagicaceae bacterium]